MQILSISWFTIGYNGSSYTPNIFSNNLFLDPKSDGIWKLSFILKGQ